MSSVLCVRDVRLCVCMCVYVYTNKTYIYISFIYKLYKGMCLHRFILSNHVSGWWYAIVCS